MAKLFAEALADMSEGGLSVGVQGLMKFFFKVDKSLTGLKYEAWLKDRVTALDYDLKKLPLGKLIGQSIEHSSSSASGVNVLGRVC